MKEITIESIAAMSPLEWATQPAEPADEWEVSAWQSKTYIQMILDIAAEAARTVKYRNKYGAENAFTRNQWQLFHDFGNVFCSLPDMDEGSKIEIRLAEWEMCNALSRNNCDVAFESIDAYWGQYLTGANTIAM